MYDETATNLNIPELRPQRAVANWLFICCALVFAMVILGGMTRLTGSGLSMVEWRPIMGSLPPLSTAEWQQKFQIYQQTPEFRLVNSHFTLDDFKGIFWLEYLHRLLGRLIGLAFALPYIYFAVRRIIPARQWPKYLTLFALGGAQALVGKIMVASGQVDAPQVSHYRLTAHLALAFLVYALMLWTALSLRYPKPGYGFADAQRARRHTWFHRSALLTALIALTVVSGGFVAGLKAGHIYNSFPKMGAHWLPPEWPALSPWWRNLFDNAAAVQFNHRVLAISTLLCCIAYAVFSMRSALPRRAISARRILLIAVIAQVTLGISTLLMSVPVGLAVTHQAVAMLLLSAALYLTHSLRAA